MAWNINFEIVAFIVLLIVMMYMETSKRIVNKQNTAYRNLLIVSFIGSAITCLGTMLLNTMVLLPLAIRGTLVILFLVLRSVQLFLLFRYIKLVTTHQFFHRYFELALYVVPLLVVTALAIAAPFSNILFVVSYEQGVVFQKGYVIVLLCWLLYTMGSLYYGWQYRKKLSFQQQLAILFSLISLLMGILVSLLSMQESIHSSVLAIMLLLFYFVIENPKLNMDELTGLMNRSAFLERLDTDMKRNVSFQIVTMAMDDFRFINETYGYHYGDLLLKAIGKKLKETSKHVFRYMGDTFCIVLYDDSEVMQTINRIKSKLDEPWNINATVCLLAASFCVVSYPDNAETSIEMTDFMVYTMQEAKKLDKGNIVYGKNSTKDKIKRNYRIEYLLKEAVQLDRFEVYYQPIYSIKQERFIAAEALVRLHDQELGFISPSEFIPLAEKNGSILKIGSIVFEKVCSFIHDHPLSTLGFEYIEVNLSVVQCMQRRLSVEMIAIMEKYQIDPTQINFEITETAVGESKGMLEHSMKKLIAYGCKFSLDDFGTGYSNLNYVTQLPFHIVKIDKGLIWAAVSNSKVNIAIDHIISMFKKMDMKIVAEGIETKEQLEMIVAMQCDYIQGYYYSKPLPIQQLLSLVKSSSLA